MPYLPLPGIIDDIRLNLAGIKAHASSCRFHEGTVTANTPRAGARELAMHIAILLMVFWPLFTPN